EAVVTFRPRALVIEAHSQRQRQAVGDLEIVIDVDGGVSTIPTRIRRNLVIRSLNLPQDERGKRVASRCDGIARGIESAGAEATEVKRAASAGRPSVEIKPVQPEFVADLNRVLSLDPRQVVSELPAIDRFKTVTNPLHPELRVRNISIEQNIRRPGGLVHDA